MSCILSRELTFVNAENTATVPLLMKQFSFLTNHGLALLCIAQDPTQRMRDIAATLDITERAAQRIVGELVQAGYIDRTREGRRNSYTVRIDSPVTLPSRELEIGSLLSVLMPETASESAREQMAAVS
jgi:DNA-binding IclR family transcriptional regulator